MRIAMISEKVSAVTQPTIIEIIGLANLGYRSVVNIRLIGDTMDSVSWLQLKAAANTWRMEATQLVIASIFLRQDEIAEVREALEKLPGPVAAFCRTDVRQALHEAFPSHRALELEQNASDAEINDHGLELLRLS